MKFVLLLCAVAGFVHAAKNVKVTSQVVEDFEFSKSMLITNEKTKSDLSSILKTPSTRLDMAIDDIVDEILGEAVDVLLANQLDPLKIPDINLEFEYRPALITYHGKLNLWGGWLQDIITIRRSGESTVSIDGNLMRAVVPIAFDDLIITYLYSATIMDLGPNGSVHGKMYDVVAKFDVTIDLETMTVTLNDFYLDAGDLGLTFYGNGLIDWLVNLLIDVVEDTLHNTVVAVMQKIVGAVVDYIVDYINDNIGDILGRQLAFEDVKNVAPKLTLGHPMLKHLTYKNL